MTTQKSQTGSRLPGSKLTPFLTVEDWSGSMNSTYRCEMGEGPEITRREGLLNGLRGGVEAMKRMKERDSFRVGRLRFTDNIECGDFLPIDEVSISDDGLSGRTHLREALGQAHDHYKGYLCELNAIGQGANVGSMLLVTDGHGQDGDPSSEIADLVDMHANQELFLIGAGVTDDDCQRLRDFKFPNVFSLEKVTFQTLFNFATYSASRLANSQFPTDVSLTGQIPENGMY